jgi:WD40 repeat protein
VKKYAIRSVELPPSPSPNYETLQGEVAKVFSLAYTSKCPTESTPCLLSAGEGNNVQVWRIDSNGDWSIQKQLSGHQDRINTVTVSPDGKTIASGSRDSTVRLWDLASGRDIGLLEGHTKFVTRVAFSSDGEWLYSASDDTTIIRTNVNFETYPNLVCNTIDRNLTCGEWRDLDTKDTAYLELCKQWKVMNCE